MYCKFCGKELPDQAKFCNVCGGKQDHAENIPTTNITNNVTDNYAKQSTPPTKTSSSIKFITLGAVALVVILLILIFTKGSYKDPLNQLVKNANKQKTDVTEYLEVFAPDFLMDTYHDGVKLLKDIDEDGYDEGMAEIEDGIDEFHDMLEDYLGKGYKITYKIDDKEKISKDDIKDIQNTWRDLGDQLEILENSLDLLFVYSDVSSSEQKKIKSMLEDLSKKMSKVKINAGYEMTVTIGIKGVDKDDLEDLYNDYNIDELEIDLNVIKINGDWYIDAISLLNTFGYLDDITDMFYDLY